MSTALKRVYVNGFSYSGGSQGQDLVVTLPLPVDILNSSSQMPSGYPSTNFVWWDTDNIPAVGRSGSASFRGDIEIPTQTSSVLTTRVEHHTYNPLIREAEEIFWSISYYTPLGTVPDPLEVLIQQWHIIGSSPFLHIRRQNGRIMFYLQMDSGFLNQQIIDVGPATPGEWINFVVYTKFRNDLNGRLTIWRNGEIAKVHDPNGNPWKPPVGITEGIPSNYVIKPSLGDFQMSKLDGDLEVSLCDWKGFTCTHFPSSEKYFKCGMYKSPWSDRYNPDGTLKDGVLDDPNNPLYVPEDLRIIELSISNLNFETRFDEIPHEDIFKSIDINGHGPIDTPEWWIDIVPLNIELPEDGSNFNVNQSINVTTDNLEGSVDLIVNKNVIHSKSEAPYEFLIPPRTIPLNGACLDFNFNGDTSDWSNLENSITLINPSDASYIEGVRGQAISLGNDSIIANKSYISITPSTRLKSISNRFTISFWIKGEPIFHRLFANNGEGKGIYFQTLSGGRIDFFIQNSGPNGESYQLRSSSTGGNGFIESDTWHHYAWIYDGNYLRCFYDLNQSNELLIEDDIDFSTESNWLINRKYDSDQPGTVSFDDFRIYDYAFTEENIQDLVEDNYLGSLDIKVRRGGVESDPITINIVDSTGEYEGPYYVSSNGDDSNEGSVSEPVQTIGKINEILAEGIDNSVSFNRDDTFEDGLEIPTINDGTSSNPIEFKSYGIGSLPVLSGFKTIDSFVNVSGNIYEVQDDNFPDYIYKVTITSVSQPKGRLPKEGWLRADSNNNNSITSTNLPSVNYSGGQVEAVVWKMQWVQDTVKVTGRTGDTLNYTGGSSYPSSPRTDGRYYIQNAIECLTEQGDWMYDTNTKTLTIYSSVDPNTLSIAYSSDKDGIEGIGNTYNSYSELSLKGSINGIDLEGSHNNEITDLVIADQSGEGIAVRNSNNVTVDGNEISDADVRGISFTNTSSSPIVFRNKASNIALNTGNPLANGDEKGNGIYFSNSENIDCQLNEVINVGFNGIRYNHNNALITRNFIEGFCKTKHDGAGIYTYGGASGANTHTDRVVSRNVVRNGGDPLRPNTYGIYVDDNSENITHSGNLIKNIWNAGHYIHNSHDLSYDGDIIYGCGTLFKFGQDGSNELIRDNTISNMVFVLTSKSDFGFEILSNANDVSSFFNINNNIYLVASNKQLVFTTRYVSGGKTFFNNVDFDGWQALGNDVNSSIRYLNIPEYSIISEGSNKWNGTVGNYHQDGEVTVNVDGSNVEILMTSQSPTTTRAEIHFRLDGVESDKDYIVRFRARALSGHQSLNLYMRQSNAPYRDLGGKTAAVVGSEWEEFEFLVTDLIAEETAGYLIDCQSNQGTLEIEDFEFVEAVVEKTIYEDYILPVSNTTSSTDNISVGSGWRNLDGEETSSVELESFESTILLSEDLPAQEYQLTVTYTAGGTATGSGEYTEGSQVQLTATPNSGYDFTGWYRDSTLLSTDNPYNYTTRGQADTVQAVFELIPIPEYTITVIPSMGGSVSGGGTYEEGQSVTLTATPNSGWTFVKWSNDATANPYSFTASENLTISAIFEEVNPEVPYIIVKGKFKIV